MSQQSRQFEVDWYGGEKRATAMPKKAAPKKAAVLAVLGLGFVVVGLIIDDATAVAILGLVLILWAQYLYVRGWRARRIMQGGGPDIPEVTAEALLDDIGDTDWRQFALSFQDGVFSTQPPLVDVAERWARLTFPLGVRTYELEKSQRTVSLMESGASFAVAHREPDWGRFTITQDQTRWSLRLRESPVRTIWEGLRGEARYGIVEHDGETVAAIRVSYLIGRPKEMVKEAPFSEILEASFSGTLELAPTIPIPVVALALRQTVKARWFGYRTGTWAPESAYLREGP